MRTRPFDAFCAAQQISPAHVDRNRCDHRLREDRGGGGLEHAGGDVGRHDADAEAAVPVADLVHDHGQGVGFGADRAGRAPDLDQRVAAGPALRQQARQRDVGQELEMVGFAKELGLVGRHEIDQMDRLGLQSAFIEQKTAVFGKIAKPDRADPFAQAALDHGLFGRGHLYATVVMDKLGQPPKILRAKAVDTHHHGFVARSCMRLNTSRNRCHGGRRRSCARLSPNLLRLAACRGCWRAEPSARPLAC